MATTRVDHFGRVVIPKPIRDDLGLDPGTELDVANEDGRIVMRSTQDEARLEIRDGILVHVGGRATGDMTNIIEKVREERIRHILGMDGT